MAKRNKKTRTQLAFELDAILKILEDSFILKLASFFKKLASQFLAKADNLPLFQKKLKEIDKQEIAGLKKLMNEYYKKVGSATIKQTRAELKELSEKSTKFTVVNVPENLRLRAEELAKQKLKDYRDNLIGKIQSQEGTLKDKALLKKQIKNASKQFINRNVTIVARMESITVANDRRLEAFQKSNIVAGVQFLAVLDKRTTQICKSRHSMILKLNDPQLPNFRPPCHFGCRSLLSPVTIFEKFVYTPNADLKAVPPKDFGKSKKKDKL